MKTIKRLFRANKTSQDMQLVRKIYAMVTLPIFLVQMTSINLFLLAPVQVRADETTVSADVATSSAEPAASSQEKQSDSTPTADKTTSDTNNVAKSDSTVDKLQPASESEKTVAPKVGADQNLAPVENDVQTPLVQTQAPADVDGSENNSLSSEPAIDSEAASTERSIDQSLAVEQQVIEPAISVQVINPVSTEAPREVWSISGNKATTNDVVEIGKTYIAPQNDQVSVTFTKLPEKAGTLSINEIHLSDQQKKSMNAVSNVAYEVTSTMTDGTFQYDLTLPKPKNAENVEVKYAEDVAGLKNANTVDPNNVQESGGSVQAKLNHFTIFFVAVGNPPLINAISFAGRSGDTTNGSYFNLDMSAVSDAALAAAGDITVSEASNLTITSPLMGLPVIALASGSNSVTISSVLGVTPTAAAVKAIAKQDGGRIIVTGILVDAADSANATSVTLNLLEDIDPPVITLFGGNYVDVSANTSYVDAGATAFDSRDGVITQNIVTISTVNTAVVGVYTVTYNVSDANGNAATPVVRTVHVLLDMTPPVISIQGTNPIDVLQNSTYIDPGALAFDNVDGNVTPNFVVTNTVNTAIIGAYIVVYDVSDAAGNAAQAIRTVNVLPDTTPPVISIQGTNPIDVLQNSTYIDPGALAFDNVDGNVTPNFVVTNTVNTAIVGTYTVTYDVSDAAGNAAQAIRTVNVLQDTIAPVISIQGANPISVPSDSTYIDPGALAFDNVDGNVTPNFVVTNTVNTAIVGTYTVTYDVSDAAGNAAQAIRTVNVYDATPPTDPVTDISAGDYMTHQIVSLSSSDEGSGLDSIYFTTDGTDPDSTKTQYVNPINVDKDMTIKAIAYDKAGNASGIASVAFGIAPVISVEATNAVSSSSATITWFTDNLATSRVVYDTVSHAAGAAPNYGYANSTIESDVLLKTASHSVMIDGLQAGTTYYYRTVSHGSPEVFGSENTFVTAAVTAAVQVASSSNSKSHHKSHHDKGDKGGNNLVSLVSSSNPNILPGNPTSADSNVQNSDNANFNNEIPGVLGAQASQGDQPNDLQTNGNGSVWPWVAGVVLLMGVLTFLARRRMKTV